MQKFVLKALILIGLALPVSLIAQPFTWDNATALGGKVNGGGGMKMTKDASGNFFMIGEFTGQRNIGAFVVNATGNNDVFVAKFNSAGICQWAINIGGASNYALAAGIAYSGGALYVTGTFSNALNVNGLLLSTSGQNDIFIAQIDPNSGIASWLIKAGGTYDDISGGICASASGGFYLTGNFTFSANFGSVNLFSGSFSNINMFVAKYSSTGTCMWAQQAGNTAQEDKGTAIQELSNGDIAVAGTFQGAATFAPYTINGSLGTDIFVASYTSAGIVNWVKHGGGRGSDIPFGMSVDPLNNIYITGVVGDTSYFDGFLVPDYGYGSVVTVKYSQQGVFQWATWGGGPIAIDSGADISTDAVGSSYVVGSLEGNAAFSGVPLVNAQGFDGFIAKYDSQGNLTWVNRVPAPGSNDTRCVLQLPGGYCYVGGEFSSSFTLGSTTLTPSGALSNEPTIFLARFGGGTVGLADPLAPSVALDFYPVPATDHLTISCSGIKDAIASVELISIEGKQLTSVPFSLNNSAATVVLDLSAYPAGTYFVRLNSINGEVTKTFIKQ
ncbi:MAG TPA: T9SS type A sorting domain-containing protein [Bacteroidia bacterium]|nr:T9SS type A sorting domain-containing protein [Bacteroidia bacterium]